MKLATVLTSFILLALPVHAWADNKGTIRAAIRANTNDTPRPPPRVQPAAPPQRASPAQSAARNDVVKHVAEQVFANGKPATPDSHRHDGAYCANPVLCHPGQPSIESLRQRYSDVSESDLLTLCLNGSDDVRGREACALIESPAPQRDGLASTKDADLLENRSGDSLSQEATPPAPR